MVRCTGIFLCLQNGRALQDQGKSSGAPCKKIWRSKFGWRRFVNGFLDLLSIGSSGNLRNVRCIFLDYGVAFFFSLA